MLVTKYDAMLCLKQLREQMAAWGKVLHTGGDELRDLEMQAAFLLTLQGCVRVLDLYLTLDASARAGDDAAAEAALMLGLRSGLIYNLSEETSYLMVRYPTVIDPGGVYLRSRLSDPELANRDVLRRWQAIDTPWSRVTEVHPW